MKVLQINSVCGVGSTGRIATDLYKVLEGQGHECVIAYGRGTAPQGIKTIRIGTNLDNYIHVAKTRLLDKHGLGSVEATKEFIKKVEEFNPDIVHLHNIHGYYINIEILFDYLKKADKPVVWTLHDCWPFTGHCAYYEYVQCEKWKQGCRECEQKNHYPNSLLVDNSQSNYALKKKVFTSLNRMVLVTPSLWLKREVEQSFLGKYEVKVINNGIDLESFKPKQSSFRESHELQDKFIVLGVASVWEERKGLKFLLEAAATLKDQYKVVIVGVNEKQKKGLPDNVIGITRTNSVEELAEIYSAADVFVNPTLEDNFPTTNIEALACGTPVITFKTGGSVESIDSSCGRVVAKGDSQELVKTIRELNENKLSSEAAIERAKRYDKISRYNDYINLYEKI